MTHIIITSIFHLGKNQFLSLVSGNSSKAITLYEQTPMATHFVAAGLQCNQSIRHSVLYVLYARILFTQRELNLYYYYSSIFSVGNGCATNRVSASMDSHAK